MNGYSEERHGDIDAHQDVILASFALSTLPFLPSLTQVAGARLNFHAIHCAAGLLDSPMQYEVRDKAQ